MTIYNIAQTFSQLQKRHKQNHNSLGNYLRSATKTNWHNFALSLSIVIMAGILLSAVSFSFWINNANAQSPYHSGYDHGCSDAKISDPDDRYINQPGKGPSYHTDEFMQGYDEGFDSCYNSSSPSGKFTVIVKVTNNGNKQKTGDITVRTYEEGLSKTLRDVVLPAKSTIEKRFTFDSRDVPVGTGFRVDISYDGITLHKTGTNHPDSRPEHVQFTIGPSLPNSGNTFKVIVKVTNTDSVDYKGQITVRIDDGPVQYQYPTFPAETTIQRTFDFDSRDVPVGTGFFAEVRYGDDYDTGIYGENTPKKAAETVQIYIPEWLN